jgi:hypothetical protein
MCDLLLEKVSACFGGLDAIELARSPSAMIPLP